MPTNLTQTLMAEFAKLTPAALIELYILNAENIGGVSLYFYDGTAALITPGTPNPPISYQGQVYEPMPIQVKGFEFRTQGELPRPSITFSNILGTFTALTLLFDDLLGAKLTRRRTFRQYLDDGTSPSVIGDTGIDDDIFYINRKVSENKFSVEFELGTSLEIEGLLLPRRQIVSNICGWNYRSAEGCAVADNRFVADLNDVSYPTDNPLIKYRGTYVNTTEYKGGDCVTKVIATDDEQLYKLDDSVLAVTGVLPPSAPWIKVQHYRGEWKAQNLSLVDITYFKDDVVYITARLVRQFFILIVDQSVGAASQPPNKNLWKADQCGKALSSCKLRQDPLSANHPLTIGSFSGTSRSPSV